jgi:hypothetical protein
LIFDLEGRNYVNDYYRIQYHKYRLFSRFNENAFGLKLAHPDIYTTAAFVPAVYTGHHRCLLRYQFAA